MNELAGEFGFRRIEQCDQEMVRGFNSAQVMTFLGVPKWKLPRIVSRMRARAAEDHGAIRLYPGVDRMLLDLSEAGVSVAVVSSNSEENIRRILGEENAARVRHFGCGASLFGKASKLRTTVKRCGVETKKAIYIGDEIRDATAARAVGMDFAGVSWGCTSVEALRREKPALMFNRMEEIAVAMKKGAPSWN